MTFTAETVAAKLALVPPAATVIEAGTVTAGLLLDRLTVRPPLGTAALNATAQLSVPAPLIVTLAQLSLVSFGTPLPVSPTLLRFPSAESLVKSSSPVADPVVVGSNCRVSVAVWLGFRVSGKLAPEAAKPVPDIADALTVTAVVPVEDSVSVCVVAAFNAASPKSTLVELRLNVDTAGLSCRAKVFATLPALAVSIADSAELAGETDAVKLALDAPAGTVIVAGTVTNELPLARFTVNPPLAAAAFRVTVQLSVPAPVIDPLAQLNALNTGTPVPPRLTAVVEPVKELLISVS